MISFLRRVYYKFLHPNKIAKKVGVQCGSNCNFGNNSNFGTEPSFIKIGNDFKSAPNVTFITHDGSVHVLRNLYPKYKEIDFFLPIIIGDNVFLGFDVVVLPGSVIGDNVIVGAGGIVKGVLDANSVYAGTPVKYICSIEEYILKNNEKFINTKRLPIEEKKKTINKWLRENYDEFNS